MSVWSGGQGTKLSNEKPAGSAATIAFTPKFRWRWAIVGSTTYHGGPYAVIMALMDRLGNMVLVVPGWNGMGAR